jgi:hypothetical protein
LSYLNDYSEAAYISMSQISFQMDYGFGSIVGHLEDTIWILKTHSPRMPACLVRPRFMKKEMVMGLGMGEGKAGHLFEQKMRRSELVS